MSSFTKLTVKLLGTSAGKAGRCVSDDGETGNEGLAAGTPGVIGFIHQTQKVSLEKLYVAVQSVLTDGPRAPGYICNFE